MAAKRDRPILFFIAGGLFAMAAVRDVFFPHFFTLGVSYPTVYAAPAFFFVALGVALSKAAKAPHSK